MVEPATADPTPSPPPVVQVACLCAAWCDLCTDYRSVLRSVAADWHARSPQHPLRWHWIDIEDEADLVGEVDVETFPTLVIADGAGVRFAGPLTPQPETLLRLLRATVLDARDDTRWPAAGSEVQAFAARLRSRPEGAT
ncbi:MAG: thioredoxin [Rubrivivax sp.]|nr:thioredoxin [Rubrivivax sp.]